MHWYTCGLFLTVFTLSPWLGSEVSCQGSTSSAPSSSAKLIYLEQLSTIRKHGGSEPQVSAFQAQRPLHWEVYLVKNQKPKNKPIKPGKDRIHSDSPS